MNLLLLLLLLSAQPVPAIPSNGAVAPKAQEEILLVKAVSQGQRVEVVARDLATNAEGTRTFSPEVRFLDLATLRTREVAALAKWDAVIITADGQVSVLALGAHVHDSIEKKSPKRAQELNSMSDNLAFLYKGQRPRRATLQPPSKGLSALLLVVEWTSRIPLTVGQEEELRRAAEKAPVDYTLFESFVPALQRVSPTEEPSLRSELEPKVKAWLARPEPLPRAVLSLAAQRGGLLAPGEPVLTEMAGSAFAEFYAFAALILRQPDAEPWEIDPGDVTALRVYLRDRWNTLSGSEREFVAQMPASWAALRHLVSFGDGEEQFAARASLAKIAQGPDGARSGAGAVLRQPKHLTLDELGGRAPVHFAQQQLAHSRPDRSRFGRAFLPGVW